MRIIVNFMHRKGIQIHCIAEDAKTPISSWVSVPGQPTLEKLLRYAGATDAEIEDARADLHRWSHGSIHITLMPNRKNLLQLHPQHARALGLW